MMDRYYGYRSESDYHESYTLAGMIESEPSRVVRSAMKKRLAEIEENRLSGCGCTGYGE